MLQLVVSIQKHFLEHSARLAHPFHLVSSMLTGRCCKCKDIRKLLTWVHIQIQAYCMRERYVGPWLAYTELTQNSCIPMRPASLALDGKCSSAPSRFEHLDLCLGAAHPLQAAILSFQRGDRAWRPWTEGRGEYRLGKTAKQGMQSCVNFCAEYLFLNTGFQLVNVNTQGLTLLAPCCTHGLEFWSARNAISCWFVFLLFY